MGLPTIGVVIPWFGDSAVWRPLAELAQATAVAAGAHQVEVVEAGTLHDARNTGLARLDTEWVVFLDADDVMGFFAVAAAQTAIRSSPSVDVHVPLVRYWRGTAPVGERDPEGPAPQRLRVAGHQHECIQECLTAGNYVVVGAPARTSLVRDVGGWRDWPVFEDWDLWLRCHLAGAVFAPYPGVYEAVARPGSRNRGRVRRDLGDRVHREIAAACGVR